jgi:hypothetical protein
MDLKTFLVLLALYLLSGLLNALLAFKSPEQWDAFAESNPRGAALRKALRKFGLDLPGLIRMAQAFLAARMSKGGAQ